MSGPGLGQNLRTFLWLQRWEIGVSVAILAVIVAALIFLGGGAGSVPWSYAFFCCWLLAIFVAGCSRSSRGRCSSSL